MQRFRGGLVFKAHRLLNHSTLGLREIKKKRRVDGWGAVQVGDGVDESHQLQVLEHSCSTPNPKPQTLNVKQECSIKIKNSHGARPVHLIITMIKWFRTSRLSIKNSLSLGLWGVQVGDGVDESHQLQVLEHSCLPFRA